MPVNSKTYLMMPAIKPLLAPKVLLGLSLVYTIILTWVSVVERDSLPSVPLFPMQDKLAHFLAYLVLSVLWGGFWLRRQKLSFWFPYLAVLLLAALIYGTIIEVLQGQITQSRSADVYDILANCLGMLVGSSLIFYIFDKLRLNSKV